MNRASVILLCITTIVIFYIIDKKPTIDIAKYETQINILQQKITLLEPVNDSLELESKELDAMIKLISLTKDKLLTQSDLVANLKFQTTTLNNIILQKDNQIKTAAEMSEELQSALKKANRQKKLYQIGSGIGAGAVILLLIK
jgi:hypothetical protein